MVILLPLVDDLPEPGAVDGALEALDGVDALGAADALGALEAADGLLGLEGFLGAQGLHGAVVGQVVGETVDLHAVLFVDVGLPTLEPFVVYQVADVLVPLLVVKFVQIAEVLGHVLLEVLLGPNVEHFFEFGEV